MAQKSDPQTEALHPLAPHPGTHEEGPGETHNDVQTVRVRSGIELGSMRFVLGLGLLAAVVALGAAYLMS